MQTLDFNAGIFHSIGIKSLLLLLLVFCSCNNPKKGSIEGKKVIGSISGTITGDKEGLIVIKKHGSDSLAIDTIHISEGKFIYNYHLDKQEQVQLYLATENDSLIYVAFQNPYFERPVAIHDFILDNSNIILSIRREDLSHAVLTGSPETDKLFKKIYVEFDQDRYYKLTHGKVTDPAVVKQFSNNRFLLKKIYEQRSLYTSRDSLFALYNSFDPSLKNSRLGRRLFAYIKSIHSLDAKN